MNITKNLCKKAFDWASNPRNTWTGIVWRTLVALMFMLALLPFVVIEHFLRTSAHKDDQATPDWFYYERGDEPGKIGLDRFYHP